MAAAALPALPELISFHISVRADVIALVYELMSASIVMATGNRRGK
jgi:hypothetical protein